MCVSEEPYSKGRRLLLELYQAALAAVDGRGTVGRYLESEQLSGKWYVVAVGKAAESMARGAVDKLGPRLAAGLLITRHDYLESCPERFECLEAGHPHPDTHSLRAGAALLSFLERIPSDAQVLFLVSGGTSALVEVLPEGVGLDDLEAVNRWLLASGLPIDSMNRVRKALSCIKGGRLARNLTGRRTEVLLISDVPDDNPATIGSGLLVADPIAEFLPADLPDWLVTLCQRADPSPAVDDPVFSSIHVRVIATNAMARAAAVEHARTNGFAVSEWASPVQGDAVANGTALAEKLLEEPIGIYVAGGECTVALPPISGRGGRCQSLALAAAQVIAGKENVYFLAAGTDGADGPGEDAGALVDGGTVPRGAAQGLVARDALARADAGTYLEASGDLIQTGPTGTNVMDLILAYKGNGH